MSRVRKYYKIVLIEDGLLTPPIANSNFEYKIGVQHSVSGDLYNCANGFHVAPWCSIRYWWERYVGRAFARHQIYEVMIGRERLAPDFDNDVAHLGVKICVRRMKLLKRVTISELKRRGHWRLETPRYG